MDNGEDSDTHLLYHLCCIKGIKDNERPAFNSLSYRGSNSIDQLVNPVYM